MSSRHINNRDNEDIQKITSIDFCIFSNKDVYNISAMKPNGVTEPESYANFVPVHDGIIDIRLGITDKSLICGTCGQDQEGCPGHFAHVKLIEKAFNVGFRVHLRKILSCICIRCSKILIHKTEAQINKAIKTKHAHARFNEIVNICKKITYCQGPDRCGKPIPKILEKKDWSGIYLIAETNRKANEEDEDTSKKKIIQRLTPENCYSILKNISNQDLKIMGFDPEKSRPENMIVDYFPIPPVQIRPSIKAGIFSADTAEDDLTHHIANIIRNNERLRQIKNDPNKGTEDSMYKHQTYLLMFFICTYYDNQIAGVTPAENKKKVIKSVAERLKGKEGRIRGNLMGKRVDKSARTVISSDPYINLNQVGVPLRTAMNLTYPETVTVSNINYLKRLIENGPFVYPGANTVTKLFVNKSGIEALHNFDLRIKKVDIAPGDIVHRQLVNGDIVLFNRQPSLHKMSMMGHKIDVIPDTSLNTFRMNVSATTPYNADFDGDKRNVSHESDILSRKASY